MSDMDAHDESEFYYPDELTDAELVEEATNTSTLLSDECIQNFIKGQQQASTVKKTMYDMNIFYKFLSDVGEQREVSSIPADELSVLLCNFYITVRKKDKTEYEPDTISSISRSIQRYLDSKNCKTNILKDDDFKMSREVLKSKRRELRKQGKGNHPNATVALTNEDVEHIFREHQFGVQNPEVLSCTMWFLITLHFGHRARHEARQLKFGDISLKKDHTTDEEYLEWAKERQTKTRHGDEHEYGRAFYPKAYATGDEKCPVHYYKQFISRRPVEANTPEIPFFLAINHRHSPEAKVWFINRPMGKNKIGRFLSSATEKVQSTMSGKFTNHSVRKTCIKTLLDRGVSHNTVAQLSGHKNPKSLDSYAVASHAQQREMSKILSGKHNEASRAETMTTDKSSSPDAPSQVLTTQMQTQALFSGAQIGVINIQTLVLPRASADSNGKKAKKRHRIIESSDEEVE